MDGIIVKTAPLDNLTIFKDSGNGTVDASKAMVQILEEKINKKIEIIEKKELVKELKETLEKEDVDDIKNSINVLNEKYDEIIKDIKEIKSLLGKKRKRGAKIKTRRT